MAEVMSIVSAKRIRRIPILRSVALAILVGFVVIVLGAEFFAPYDPAFQSRELPSAPRTKIHFLNAAGEFEPSIRRIELVDPLDRRYAEDDSHSYPIAWLVEGEPYQLFGMFSVRRHLFGVRDNSEDVPRMHLLGTDPLGRDRFSRLLIATKFSLLVAPIGALLALGIGVLIGLISGYAQRSADMVIMGVTDTVLALPTLVLILAARAAFPLDLPPLRAAFLLVMIFALTGWAEIARLTRGLVRSIKEREYILAARSIGLSETRIAFRHVLPNALGPLLTQALLMLPYFLLSEVALSFLGVGLQEPAPSLGNMLAAASDISQLQKEPFLLLAPAAVIFLFVFAVRALAEREAD